MAAYRSGIKTVLIPKDNVPDLYDVEEVVKKHVEFVPVERIEQVLKAALVRMPSASCTVPKGGKAENNLPAAAALPAAEKKTELPADLRQ